MSNRDRVFKIVIIGDGGVGKTSIRRRYFGEGFQENYHMTLGADFSVKNEYIDGTKYVLQIWDLAGQPRFKEVRNAYYKNMAGMIMVFDLTVPESFTNLHTWLKEVSSITNIAINDIPIILVGNKVDLRGTPGLEVVTSSHGFNYVKDLSEWSNYDIPYVETSALVNINIEFVFQQLVKNLEVKRLAKSS